VSLTLSSSKSRIAGASGLLLLLALGLNYSGSPWSEGARDLALVVASVVAGAPISVRAWQSLRNRAFSIDLLVTIAVVGALVIGEYVESAVVSFLFVSGAHLEARTLDRTRRSLRELVDLAPQEAEVLRGGVATMISVDDVEVGDRVLVRTGGRVPVDGSVVHGAASVDESAITGEPLPVGKDVGDPMWSGTVLEDGYVELRADRVGEDTTFAQIVELVEEAQDSKARTQRFLDRFAAWYTPAIMIASVVALLWTWDVRFALTFLVIACPGALVISTPVSLVAGLGNAARHGALIKGGDALERLARFDTLVLDKTGTLTRGRPEVTEVVALTSPLDENEVLRLAGSLEQTSEHPLGRTIVGAAVAQGLHLSAAPAGVEVVKGAGIRGLVDDEGRVRAVAVGSDRLLTDMRYAVPTEVRERASTLERGGNTVSYVTVDDTLVGLVAIADRVRAEAAEAIASLRRRGVDRFVMLTGDNAHTAAAVAAQVGIAGEHDEVHARLLPQDKVAHVRRLTGLGHRVAMIGDGVNDAPAIASADIGFAMGGGTDVSLETADVVLVGNRFDQLLQARSVARSTLWNMAQNTTIALATVAILLIGVVGGLVHMAGGMLVHEISVLVVILNAMRLIRHRDTDASRISRQAGRPDPVPTSTPAMPAGAQP
jgi:Cd2+/Zn2+-exporting ATPase